MSRPRSTCQFPRMRFRDPQNWYGIARCVDTFPGAGVVSPTTGERYYPRVTLCEYEAHFWCSCGRTDELDLAVDTIWFSLGPGSQRGSDTIRELLVQEKRSALCPACKGTKVEWYSARGRVPEDMRTKECVTCNRTPGELWPEEKVGRFLATPVWGPHVPPGRARRLPR